MAQFNGKGTGTVRNSINVSSVSDLGTGKYRVNIDNDIVPAVFLCLYTIYD